MCCERSDYAGKRRNGISGRPEVFCILTVGVWFMDVDTDQHSHNWSLNICPLNNVSCISSQFIKKRGGDWGGAQ